MTDILKKQSYSILRFLRSRPLNVKPMLPSRTAEGTGTISGSGSGDEDKSDIGATTIKMFSLIINFLFLDILLVFIGLQ